MTLTTIISKSHHSFIVSTRHCEFTTLMSRPVFSGTSAELSFKIVI